jgi:hypothetical protein
MRIPSNIATMPYVNTYDMVKSAKWDSADDEKPTLRFYFLGLKAVKEGGQTGENLFRLLSELKAERDVPPSKSVCAVTDGAKNMTSDDVGLAMRIVQASLGAIRGVCVERYMRVLSQLCVSPGAFSFTNV